MQTWICWKSIFFSLTFSAGKVRHFVMVVPVKRMAVCLRASSFRRRAWQKTEGAVLKHRTASSYGPWPFDEGSVLLLAPLRMQGIAQGPALRANDWGEEEGGRKKEERNKRRRRMMMMIKHNMTSWANKFLKHQTDTDVSEKFIRLNFVGKPFKNTIGVLELCLQLSHCRRAIYNTIIILNNSPILGHSSQRCVGIYYFIYCASPLLA